MKADEFTHNYMKVILFEKFLLNIRKDQIFFQKLMLNKF